MTEAVVNFQTSKVVQELYRDAGIVPNFAADLIKVSIFKYFQPFVPIVSSYSH